MTCETCKGTGYYRMGRSYKRCGCGVGPKDVPKGCYPFTIDVDSKAGKAALERAAERDKADRAIPAHAIDKVAAILGQFQAPFVLTWLDRGELQTLHGLGPHVVAGPRSQSSDTASRLREKLAGEPPIVAHTQVGHTTKEQPK